MTLIYSIIMGALARTTARIRWIAAAIGAVGVAVVLAFLKGRSSAGEHYRRKQAESRARYNERLARIKEKQAQVRGISDEEIYRELDDGNF